MGVSHIRFLCLINVFSIYCQCVEQLRGWDIMNHSLELQILIISDLFNAISVKSTASVRSCVFHVPVLYVPVSYVPVSRLSVPIAQGANVSPN